MAVEVLENVVAAEIVLAERFGIIIISFSGSNDNTLEWYSMPGGGGLVGLGGRCLHQCVL